MEGVLVMYKKNKRIKKIALLAHCPSECSVVEGVGGLQDDRRQQEVEEEVRGEGRQHVQL